MTVGIPLAAATVNAQISNVALAMRGVMEQVSHLSKNVNGQGNGLAVLEAAGFTAPDAATALAAISYLETVAAVYFGTAAQTPAFSFDQELSQWWGGQ
jgi:hypothetical protein